MRHFYKSHGKHCYLRSFQTKCPRCGIDVLYWECRHGSKVFFNYPPYGKLVRHLCRQKKGVLNIKKQYKIIVKTPQGLLGKESPSCPVCGKLFKSDINLKDHLKNSKNNDDLHKAFLHSELIFEEENREINIKNSDKIKVYNKPKFGRINITKRKNFNNN
ncbi:MAG: hypothetical protein ACFFB0_18040 [Promethearchaeota archaeon]